MKKEIINPTQGITLVTLFIMGTTLVMGTGAGAGKDAWLAVIIAFIFVFPILMIYSRILYLFPGNDLFDICHLLFSKYLGKIFIILYTWFAFHLGALILRNLGEFILGTSLPNTPRIVSMAYTAILGAWSIKKGIEVLGRWSSLALLVLVFFLVFAMFLLFPIIDINNIKPVLFKGMKPVLKDAFSIFSFPFAETVIFCLVFSCFKDKKSPYKVFTIGLILGGLVVLLVTFIDILFLGEIDYSSLFFPSYSTLRRLNVGGVFQRIEGIVVIYFIGGTFIKLCICLLGACKGTSKLFGLDDYRFTVIPITFLMLILAHYIYGNVAQMFEWAFTTWTYYAFPFQVIFPIIIWITAEIKKNKLTY